MGGVMHQLSDPALRRISTLATAPFLSSMTASHPVSLITRPRKSRRLGLWRAGNNDIGLHAKRSQSAANIAALLNAVFVESALLVFLRARAETALPGTR